MILTVLLSIIIAIHMRPSKGGSDVAFLLTFKLTVGFRADVVAFLLDCANVKIDCRCCKLSLFFKFLSTFCGLSVHWKNIVAPFGGNVACSQNPLEASCM